MVLGGTAVVIVGPVLRGKDADLAGDVGNNIFVDLFGIGEATLPGEEPHEDGEAEAGGPLALTGEQDMLVWSERPRFFEPPVGRLSPHVPLAPLYACSDDALPEAFRYENDSTAPTRNVPAQM